LRNPSSQEPKSCAAPIYEILNEGYSAQVCAQGATLLSLSRGEFSLIEGPPVGDPFSPDGRGQVLAPWPNRLGGGSYTWAGFSHQLPINEVERNCAIHGLVRWAQWEDIQLEPDNHRILFGHRILPRPGYPFCLDLSVEYQLGEDGLCVTTRAKVPAGQVGSKDPGTLVPFGVGFHPYLVPGAAGNPNEWLLQLPVESVLTCDERGLPTGIRSLDETKESLDWRRPSAIGNAVLDHTFQIARTLSGRAEAILADPESAVQVVLWCEDGFKWLQCFTGDTLPPERKRRAVAIEPMTCPPNAFATGWDVIALAPGEEWMGRWGLELRETTSQDKGNQDRR